MSSLAESIISRQAALESDAAMTRTLWQEASDYIMPRRGQITVKTAPGQDQTSQIFDTTASESNLIFAAGMLSQVVPPGEIWARIEPAAKDASELEKQWFYDCTQKIMEAIYGSNFYLTIHEAFLDAGCFNTSAVYLEQGKRSFLNFVHFPVGTYVCSEDNEGRIDTVFRKWQWSARQAEQQWGKAKLGKLVNDALSSQNPTDPDKKFWFIHAVYPRREGEYKEGLVDASMRPVASCFVCIEDKHLVEEGGFYEMPTAVARVMKSNGEVYGRGPGLDLLPEIKLVNRMEYDLLLALEKEVNPGWLMPEDSSYRPDNRPNGVTYWDATNQANKPEVIQRNARIDLGEQKTEQKRERIRRGFFVDMFQMLNRPEVLTGDKTAFQIAEMLQEKLLLFAPFFARTTQEKLTPLLERVFAMMLREGLFDPPPVEMGQEYKITYTSKIAMAIKAAQDNAVVDMLQLCSLMAPFDQSVPMVLKWRDAYRQMARNRGVPANMMRPDEEIDEMVAQMQQAASALEAAKVANEAAGAAQKLGPEAQNAALSAITGT